MDLWSHWQELVSALGVLIAALAAIMYFRSILTGETKPHRVTWGGWTLVGVLGLVASLQGGAGIGLAVTAAFVLGVALTFALSLNPKYGKPGGARWELIAGLVAGIALVSQLFVSYSPKHWSDIGGCG